MNELVIRFFKNLYTGLFLGFFYFDKIGLFLPVIFYFYTDIKRSINLLSLILLGKGTVFLFFSIFCIKYSELLVRFGSFNYFYLEFFLYLFLIFLGLFLVFFYKKKCKFFDFYYFIFGLLIGFIPDIKHKIFFLDNILYNDNYTIKILLIFFYVLTAFLSPYIFFVFSFSFIFDKLKKMQVSFYIKYLFFNYIKMFCGIMTVILGAYNLYLIFI